MPFNPQIIQAALNHYEQGRGAQIGDPPAIGFLKRLLTIHTSTPHPDDVELGMGSVFNSWFMQADHTRRTGDDYEVFSTILRDAYTNALSTGEVGHQFDLFGRLADRTRGLQIHHIETIVVVTDATSPDTRRDVIEFFFRELNRNREERPHLTQANFDAIVVSAVLAHRSDFLSTRASELVEFPASFYEELLIRGPFLRVAERTAFAASFSLQRRWDFSRIASVFHQAGLSTLENLSDAVRHCASLNEEDVRLTFHLLHRFQTRGHLNQRNLGHAMSLQHIGPALNVLRQLDLVGLDTLANVDRLLDPRYRALLEPGVAQILATIPPRLLDQVAVDRLYQLGLGENVLVNVGRYVRQTLGAGGGADHAAALNNDAQSIHTNSVHESIWASIGRLDQRYGAQVDRQGERSTLSEVEHYLMTGEMHAPAGTEPMQYRHSVLEDFRRMVRASEGDYLGGHGDPSGITTRRIIALLWLALHDEDQRIGSLRDGLGALIAEGFYANERAYSTGPEDDDRVACRDGCRLRIVDAVAPNLPNILEVRVLTPATAGLKLMAVARRETLDLLTQHANAQSAEEYARYRGEFNQVRSEGVGAVWEQIGSRVIGQILAEYRSIFPGGERDSQFLELVEQVREYFTLSSGDDQTMEEIAARLEQSQGARLYRNSEASDRARFDQDLDPCGQVRRRRHLGHRGCRILPEDVSTRSYEEVMRDYSTVRRLAQVHAVMRPERRGVVYRIGGEVQAGGFKLSGFTEKLSFSVSRINEVFQGYQILQAVRTGDPQAIAYSLGGIGLSIVGSGAGRAVSLLRDSRIVPIRALSRVGAPLISTTIAGIPMIIGLVQDIQALQAGDRSVLPDLIADTALFAISMAETGVLILGGETGPEGELAAMLITVGLESYKASLVVAEIEKHMRLTWQERLSAGFQIFVGGEISEDTQDALQRTGANERLIRTHVQRVYDTSALDFGGRRVGISVLSLGAYRRTLTTAYTGGIENLLVETDSLASGLLPIVCSTTKRNRTQWEETDDFAYTGRAAVQSLIWRANAPPAVLVPAGAPPQVVEAILEGATNGPPHLVGAGNASSIARTLVQALENVIRTHPSLGLYCIPESENTLEERVRMISGQERNEVPNTGHGCPYPAGTVQHVEERTMYPSVYRIPESHASDQNFCHNALVIGRREVLPSDLVLVALGSGNDHYATQLNQSHLFLIGSGRMSLQGSANKNDTLIFIGSACTTGQIDLRNGDNLADFSTYCPNDTVVRFVLSDLAALGSSLTNVTKIEMEHTPDAGSFTSNIIEPGLLFPLVFSNLVDLVRSPTNLTSSTGMTTAHPHPTLSASTGSGTSAREPLIIQGLRRLLGRKGKRDEIQLSEACGSYREIDGQGGGDTISVFSGAAVGSLLVHPGDQITLAGQAYPVQFIIQHTNTSTASAASRLQPISIDAYNVTKIFETGTHLILSNVSFSDIQNPVFKRMHGQKQLTVRLKDQEVIVTYPAARKGMEQGSTFGFNTRDGYLLFFDPSDLPTPSVVSTPSTQSPEIRPAVSAIIYVTPWANETTLATHRLLTRLKSIRHPTLLDLTKQVKTARVAVEISGRRSHLFDMFGVPSQEKYYIAGSGSNTYVIRAQGQCIIDARAPHAQATHVDLLDLRSLEIPVDARIEFSCNSSSSAESLSLSVLFPSRPHIPERRILLATIQRTQYPGRNPPKRRLDLIETQQSQYHSMPDCHLHPAGYSFRSEEMPLDPTANVLRVGHDKGMGSVMARQLMQLKYSAIEIRGLVSSTARYYRQGNHLVVLGNNERNASLALTIADFYSEIMEKTCGKQACRLALILGAEGRILDGGVVGEFAQHASPYDAYLREIYPTLFDRYRLVPSMGRHVVIPLTSERVKLIDFTPLLVNTQVQVRVQRLDTDRVIFRVGRRGWNSLDSTHLVEIRILNIQKILQLRSQSVYPKRVVLDLCILQFRNREFNLLESCWTANTNTTIHTTTARAQVHVGANTTARTTENTECVAQLNAEIAEALQSFAQGNRTTLSPVASARSQAPISLGLSVRPRSTTRSRSLSQRGTWATRVVTRSSVPSRGPGRGLRALREDVAATTYATSAGNILTGILLTAQRGLRSAWSSFVGFAAGADQTWVTQRPFGGTQSAGSMISPGQSGESEANSSDHGSSRGSQIQDTVWSLNPTLLFLNLLVCKWKGTTLKQGMMRAECAESRDLDCEVSSCVYQIQAELSQRLGVHAQAEPDETLRFDRVLRKLLEKSQLPPQTELRDQLLGDFQQTRGQRWSSRNRERLWGRVYTGIARAHQRLHDPGLVYGGRAAAGAANRTRFFAVGDAAQSTPISSQQQPELLAGCR